MKLLLTGATGRVGSHLLPRLVAQGHDVVAMARFTQSVSSPLSGAARLVLEAGSMKHGAGVSRFPLPASSS